MKKLEIIKKNTDFNDIINTGAYLKNRYYYIYYKVSDIDFPKFGLAVSKKVINAVGRNKIKRQLRFIVDNNKELFAKNYLYIIMVRKEIINIGYKEMEYHLTSLVKKGNYNEKV